MLKQIKDTTAFLSSKTDVRPGIGIITGTGLGTLTADVTVEAEIPYADIPHFPVSTVKGHQGKLIFGHLEGKPVVVMQGRFHYYEGYTMKEVTYPIRVMKALGINHLIISNASGGLNPDYKIGDLMIINDHINLFPDNPLMGKNYDDLGPRFPDMSQAYDKWMINHGMKLARTHNIVAHQGVYVGVSGPTFETPAEYKYIRLIGGDAVGMSTVPEVIVARHAGIKVFAVSVITDSGVPGEIVEITHEDVQAAAATATPKLQQIVKDMLHALPAQPEG